MTNKSKSNPVKRDSALHAGHRQRLKDKVRKAGLDCLSTHEVLELILTYAIPRKDVNELAHRLLLNYGSIKNILHCSREELETNKGVSQEASLFLTMLPQFFKLYETKDKDDIVYLKEKRQCVNYFLTKIGIKEQEESYALFVDDNYKLKKVVLLSVGDLHSITLDRVELSKKLTSGTTKKFILIHTHPNGSVEPSGADLKATSSIMSITYVLGMEMLDHIIINSCESYSFKQKSIIEKIKLDIIKDIDKAEGSFM